VSVDSDFAMREVVLPALSSYKPSDLACIVVLGPFNSLCHLSAGYHWVGIDYFCRPVLGLRRSIRIIHYAGLFPN
jgi:hypothetical protein